MKRWLVLGWVVAGSIGLGCSEGTTSAPADGGTGATGGAAGAAAGGSGGGGTGGGGTGGASGGATGGSGGSGGSGGGPVTNDCTGTPPPALRLTEIVGDLDSPMMVATPPRDASIFYIPEKDGAIQVFDGTTTHEMVDLNPKISSSGERGLLGFAFHPDYDGASNRRFFVHYSDNSGNTVISELEATTATSADSNAERIILTVNQPAANHNGGTIAFGPDGYLYVGLGDGGGGGDQYDNGQTATTQLGAMLRIDVDAYPTAPAGNYPGGHPDVYHIGLRNPFRWSFDRLTGDMYVGDVGQNAWEEVAVLAADAGPSNFGWPIAEANHCFRGGGGCDQTGLVPALREFANPADGRSVIGGYVYRGSAIPGLVGRYFYADFYTQRVWTVRWDGAQACDDYEISQDLQSGSMLGGLVAFGEDANGELYVVSLQGGRVFRIDAE